MSRPETETTVPNAEPLQIPTPERPTISVVIPAYDEAAGITQTLTRLRGYLLRTPQRFELLVIDDGSRDETAAAVRDFARTRRNIRLITNGRNRGKGYSVRQGMLTATGDVLLLCDADLSTPIEEVEKLLPRLAAGADVVIGSRDLPQSVLAPPQPMLRRLLAGGFRALRRTLLVPRLRDTQCGFKLFRRDVAREVFSRSRLSGWLSDCEVLAVADRLGYRIEEVAVEWRNRRESRVSVGRAALAALPTLLLIRWRVRGLRPRRPARA